MSIGLEDFDVDPLALSLNEQLGVLINRAKAAQDACGWADPTTEGGQMYMASGVVEYGRILTEILMILRSTVGVE